MSRSKAIFEPEQYTVGWICALSLEMGAARGILDDIHPDLSYQDPNDSNSYILGEIHGHNIVVACLPSGIYGTTPAATVATNLLRTFKSIRFGLLVGIGGGAPSPEHDIRLGDVVISQPSETLGGIVQHDRGKILSQGGFERTGSHTAPPTLLLSALSRLRATHMSAGSQVPKFLAELVEKAPERMESKFKHQGASDDRLYQADYDHVDPENPTCDSCDAAKIVSRADRCDNEPFFHYGIIASGNQVIKDGRTRKSLSREYGALCFEMEAAGLYDFPCLVIRGICDYADSHKNKVWQEYAAATAAAFTKELLLYVAPEQVLKERKLITELISAVKESHEISKQNLEEQKSIKSLLESRPLDLFIVHKARHDSEDVKSSPKCEPGTRVCILGIIEQWANHDSNQPLFWLVSPAGVGKSTIARSAIDIFETDKHSVTGYFFKRGEQNRNDTNRIFSTIAMQIADSVHPFRESLRKSLEGLDKDAVESFNLEKQFQKLLRQPMETLKRDEKSQLRIIIIIDALDECERPEHLQRILKLLSNLCKISEIHSRVLITSRSAPDIIEAFEPHRKNNAVRILQLHREYSEETKTDIRNFLEAKFQHIRSKRSVQKQPWPTATQLNELVQLSTTPEPLFIYAATVCRFVSDDQRGPTQQLEIWLKQGGKSQLQQIYSPILDQAFSNFNQVEFRQKLQFLASVVLLATPLSAKGIANILTMDLDNISWWIPRLYAVLKRPFDLERPIELLHKSFSDFLLNDLDSNKYRIDTAEIHFQLADGCITLMIKRLKQDICGIGRLDATPEDVGKDTLSNYLPAELEYACMHWVHHLEASGRPNDKMYGFLLDHFLHWLEALSILKRLPHGLKVLQNLTDFVKKSYDTTSNLMGFLDDGRRAALRVASIIESAPLQAYASLLFFSPVTCRIRHQFWAERLPASLHVEGIKSDWDGHFQTLKLPEIVGTLSFSPDGRFLASASDADDVRVWNASTGTHLISFEAESRPDTAVVFSPDSQYLAVGYHDRRIRIWDLTTCTHIETLSCPGIWITAIILSSDGRLLSATSDGKVLFWHAKTGTLIKLIECPKGNSTLRSATFSSNLQFVAWSVGPWAREGAGIQLWNLDTGTIRHILPVNCSSDPMAFSPNNKFLVCILKKELQIWNTATGKLEYTLQDWDLGRYDYLTSIAFSSDCQLLASASGSKIRLWNLVTRDPHDILINTSAEISVCTFSPDSQMIAAGLNNGEIQIWATAYTGRKSPDHGSAGRHLVLLSPNHQWVVSGPYRSSRKGTLRLWDVSTGKLQRTVDSIGSFYHVQFSPNSEYLAWKSSSSNSFIWNLDDGTKQEIIDPDAKRFASHIAYSPSGQLAAICWEDKAIELYDAMTGSHIYSLPQQDVRIQTIAFSPDNHILALKTEHKIQFWNVETRMIQDELGEPLGGAYSKMVFSRSGEKLALQRNLNIVWWDTQTRDYESSPDLSGFVSEFAFTSDFLLLAVASTDEPHTNSIKIHLHDINLGNPQDTLHGHQGYVMRLEFLPDSRILAVASEDRTVRLWDVTTHSQLHTFNTYNAVPRMMRFSDNGHIIAVESMDRTIRLWNTKTGKFLQMVQYDKGFLHEMAISLETLDILLSDVSHDGFWDPWQTLSHKLHVYHYPILNDDHTVTHDPGFRGTNLSADGSWLMKDSEKLLWIPPEYRTEMVVQGFPSWDKSEGAVFVGCESGRMVQLRYN